MSAKPSLSSRWAVLELICRCWQQQPCSPYNVKAREFKTHLHIMIIGKLNPNINHFFLPTNSEKLGSFLVPCSVETHFYNIYDGGGDSKSHRLIVENLKNPDKF